MRALARLVLLHCCVRGEFIASCVFIFRDDVEGGWGIVIAFILSLPCSFFSSGGLFFFVSFLGKVMASARLVFHGIPKMQS